MKTIYSFVCVGVICYYVFLTYTGRSIFQSSSERMWTKPGQRVIYYHK